MTAPEMTAEDILDAFTVADRHLWALMARVWAGEAGLLRAVDAAHAATSYLWALYCEASQ